MVVDGLPIIPLPSTLSPGLVVCVVVAVLIVVVWALGMAVGAAEMDE